MKVKSHRQILLEKHWDKLDIDLNFSIEQLEFLCEIINHYIISTGDYKDEQELRNRANELLETIDTRLTSFIRNVVKGE